MAETATNLRSAEGSMGPDPGVSDNAARLRASALFTYAFDPGTPTPSPVGPELLRPRQRRPEYTMRLL